MHRFAAITLISAAALVGCGPPPNVVLVEVCGDVQIPNDIDAVRLSVLDADRGDFKSGTLELLRCPENEALELPQTSELEAPTGEAWVVAQGLQQGVEVIRFERRVRVEETGRAQDVILGLTRSCMRIDCPLGQTCIDGTCKVTDWESTDAVCSGGAPSEGAGVTQGAGCGEVL